MEERSRQKERKRKNGFWTHERHKSINKYLFQEREQYKSTERQKEMCMKEIHGDEYVGGWGWVRM